MTVTAFFQSLSLGLYGYQNIHVFIRQRVADFIEQCGTAMDGLIKCCSLDFHYYVSALRSPGHYDYASEDVAMDTTEIFKREI